MTKKTWGVICVALGLALMALTNVREAKACGGCFTAPRSVTQVTGHRMLLSLSNEQTTLYDQIEYDGDPESFAWVLPIKGVAEIGLSSDMLFNMLDRFTEVIVRPPPLNCPFFGGCPNYSTTRSTATTSATTTTTGGEEPVEVLAQETVGPFETVQLSSSDPNALIDWLASHGYNVPQEIQPLIDAYVSESFNFLAMKLVPGVGVDAMRPVRITTAGASPALPLRMVAAGTGFKTTVTLWVIAEGRYQPANFPWFTIERSELVWNWSNNSSNYTTLRQQRYAESDGLGWLIESAYELELPTVEGAILDQAAYPASSGYDPMNAEQEALEDLEVLFGTLSPTSIWITRMRAELTREAFTKDMYIEAADSQTFVPTVLQLDESQGQGSPCPPRPTCYDPTYDDDGEGCATRGSRTTLGWITMPVLALLVLLRSRRRR